VGGIKILVIDDDMEVAESLLRVLRQEGFGASHVGSGLAADDTVLRKVSLVLCDVNLPGENGFDVARRLRATHPQIGLIMLTGRGDLIDRVLGLEMGADDYIQKPFELRELLARIRAVLRRRDTGAGPATGPVATGAATITFGKWVVDPGRRTVTAPDDQVVEVTTTEFDIFCLLGRRQRQTVSREMLYDVVKGKAWSPLDRTLDTHVANLRKKLASFGYRDLIKTVHGQGYILVPGD